MRKTGVFIIFFVLSLTSFSQAWKRERVELSLGLGTTSFLGDLGGSASEGGNYGPKDLDYNKSGFGISAGYRYYMRKNLSAKGNLSYGMVFGDDAESQNPTRNARGLKFRSMIIEASAQLEYYFFSERTRGVYRLKGSRGLKKLKFDAYVFGGIGLFYFNPKNEKDGTWYALQPMGTEGQTAGHGKKYSRIQGCLPIGIGLKKKINRHWSVGLEFGLRMTTTDYIDDVSGTYYHRQAIRDANPGNPDLAEYFSNPRPDAEWPSVTYSGDGTYTLQQRGDPTRNDTYTFGFITVNYKMKARRRSMPKF